eukprot:CAMPEP_0179271588 /NCGR_PEP_ID=MMETSP0797-20121207/32059_1 /TAXON_ID=47934 /ORGANISM="Dinophysis acuminata, Strain DAEP01" /LENGTH=338 /DNA_ID=CAMNT_0020979957 /DNA_START=165 /DNA_END=1181 /DNA_ORIENTATION=+
MNDRDCRTLFDRVAGRDQKISFEEFVDYCYQQEHSAGRTTAGRHERLAQSTAISADSDNPSLWVPLEEVYNSFLGKDGRFEGRDFAKLCKDSKLVDSKFSNADIDLTFAKYKEKKQNTITFDSFQNCLREVARKRGKPTSEVQQLVVAKAASGPSKTGTTTAEYTRFYDDKSLYTGQHAHSGNLGDFGNADHSPGARHERIRAAASLQHNEADEADWDELQKSFYGFCNGIDGSGDNLLDGREFKQLCEDCGLFKTGVFEARDGDLIFTKVKNKGERRIDFHQFKDAVLGVSGKLGIPVRQVQAKISEVHGPSGRGTTKAGYIKFHDDKSLYTGTSAA